MGNSESNCCDILKEDTGTGNSINSNKNCQDSNVVDDTMNDEREISLKSKSLKSSQDGKTNQSEQGEYILDDTHTLASTVIEDSNINNDAPTSLETDELLRTPRIKAVKECLFDPRSPSSGINRTPCGVMYISNTDANVDPRSPSTGVDRTPIVFKDKPEELPIADPRSPSVGIDRTPIVMEKLEESSSSGMKVSEDQKDPRSPMAEVSRTPIRTLYNSSNLRRTVLLSNTLMSSPCTGAASVEKTNQDDNSDQQDIHDNQDIPAINIEESSPTSNEKITITQNTLLNLSCASNLNESLSSSMVAVLGSDSRSVNFDELSDAEANSCNVSMDEYYDLCGEVKEVVNDMVLEACIDAKSLDEKITEKAQLVTDSELESPKEVQEDSEQDTLTSKIREETEGAEIEILTKPQFDVGLKDEFMTEKEQDSKNLDLHVCSPSTTCESTSSDLVIQDGEVSLLDGELYQDNEVQMENLKQFLREEENVTTSVEECADERNNSKFSVSIERGGERKSSLKKASAPNKKTNIPSLSTATAPAKRSSYASSGKKAASTGALGHVILKDSGEKSSPVIREASFAVFKHSDAKAPNRPPLAVLGHCNSPETTKGRSNRFGTSEQHSIKNQSRVPRYRGSRSSTQSITNAAALNGKEN